MGTFLTNPKMSPELRARIEASVRGQTTKKSPARRRPIQVFFLRLGVAMAAICLVSFVAIGVTHSRAELAEGRKNLVERVAKVDDRLTAADRELPVKVAAALLEASHSYPGDHVDGTAGLQAMLKRPSVYVRADFEELTRGRAVSSIAEDSTKDALAFCLLSPPEGRDEEALLPKVYEAYRGAKTMAEVTSSLYRLHDALTGLRSLDQDWRMRAEDASNKSELRTLSATLDPKRLERAIPAAKAELLVYVMDEPKKPSTVTELDGASDHVIRMGIVDLNTDKVLVRYRARVDPSWVSEQRRTSYARGLCDCRFAHDLHESVNGS
jgi:hypothetical protein